MRFVGLALNLALLAASLLPALAHAQESDCQSIITADAAQAISAQIKQLADELRQVQNTPADTIVKGTDKVTVGQYIQAHRVLLQRLTDCLAQSEIGEPPTGPEEAAAPPDEPAVPTQGAIGFIQWQPSGVCVLASAYCIDFDGNQYSRGESPPAAAAPAEPAAEGSASIAPPSLSAASFAGNWNGRFSGPIGTAGCQTTESGSFSLRLEQPTQGGPVTGTASYNGNIVSRTCGNTSLGGADNCASARIGPATPAGLTLRFQLTCNGSTEAVNLNLDSATAASGNKNGRDGEVSWDMTFNLTK